MALRRDIDEYLGRSFEELVELIVEQNEKIEELEECIGDYKDIIDEKDEYIHNLLEAV